jgi:transcription elongation factor S-II
MASPRLGVRKILESVGLNSTNSHDLEIGIYNYSIDYASTHRIPLTWNCDNFVEIYLAKARSVYANINPDSYIQNEKLLQRINDKEFLPHELPFMSKDMIFPEKWSDIITEEQQKFKNAYETAEVAMTDLVRCGKCKKNKIKFFEMQTRSADEPTTHFYTCISCGHRWRQ